MGRVVPGLRAGVAVGVLSLAAGCFWPVPGQGPSRQAHNDLESAIGTDTVAGLALAWEAQVDGGAVGDPITSLYGVHVNDARSVYGFDRDSGDRVWDYGVADADTMGQPLVHGERLHVDMITGSTPAQYGASAELDPATGLVLTEPVSGRAVAFRDNHQLRFHDSRHFSLGVWLWQINVVDTSTGTSLCCGGLTAAKESCGICRHSTPRL
jgi:hypothetical protein